MPKGKLITLQQARRDAGLGVVQLAKLAGVTVAQIEQLEQGRVHGTLLTRHRLSDALGIPFRLMWPDSLTEYAELMARMKNGPDVVSPPAQPAEQDPEKRD